jgi:16S rRNA (cytosine967-C5)-methyltransferase
MIAPARVAALRVCELVERGDATLPDALAQTHTSLPDARDRALAAEIATGVFRWRAALDYAIAAQLTRPIARVDAVVLGILRISAYQLLFLDRVPARAVVDDAVSLTRQRKRTSATGFVNAVLRKLAGQSRDALLPPPSAADDYLTITLSHPRWLIDRWVARYGVEATEAWARFDNGNAPLTLRANTLRTTREALMAQLAALDVITEPTRYAPDGLIVRGGHPLRTPLASRGMFVAQDEASQLVGCLAQAACAHLLQTRARVRAAAPGAPAAISAAPPLRVLDACASPGGKTLALASALAAPDADASAATNADADADAASRIQIIAADRRTRRMHLLRDTITVAGARNVRLVQLDLEEGLPFRDAFDLILVDAPCSGLGTLRREPEIRWRRTDADLPHFAARQQRMLQQAMTALRPGGLLIYATCSSEPDENEAVAAAFQPHADAVDPRSWPLPAPLAELINDAGHLRTLPHVHGLEAFFGAAFSRRD